MNSGISTIIDGLVAILLLLTIGYCMLLNRRLKLLKADEQSLRATISELVTATEIAERAISGLKVTVRDCDSGLGERVRSAERLTAELDLRLASGKNVLERLSQIVTAVRPPIEPPAKQSPAQEVAAAAQAFANKLRTKAHGLAA